MHTSGQNFSLPPALVLLRVINLNYLLTRKLLLLGNVYNALLGEEEEEEDVGVPMVKRKLNASMDVVGCS